MRATRALFESRKDSEGSVLPDVVPSGNVRGGVPGKIVVPKFESKPIEKTPIIINKGPETIVENTPAASIDSREKESTPGPVVAQQQQAQQKAPPQEFSYTKNLLKEERRESVDAGANYEEQDWEGEYRAHLQWPLRVSGEYDFCICRHLASVNHL